MILLPVLGFIGFVIYIITKRHKDDKAIKAYVKLLNSDKKIKLIKK